MALIKCPECGRENVSSAADSCPNCGYPIRKDYEAKKELPITHNGSVVYYDVLTGKEKLIFNNGFESGNKGKCTDKMGEWDYWVDGKTLYIKHNAGTAEYKITKDFLLNQKGKHSGYLEDSDSLNTSVKSANFMGGEDIYTFFWNGKFSEICFGVASGGSYARKSDLVAFSANSTGNNPNCYVIYDHTMYSASYISEDRIEDVHYLLNNFYSLSSKLSIQAMSTTSFSSSTSNNKSSVNYSSTHTSANHTTSKPSTNSKFGKIIGAIFAIVVCVFLVKACTGDSYDANDGKCDICGKTAYTKLSDGNEYCYEHYKNAINYYLDN